MYSLIGIDNECFAIMNYTMSAMREQEFTELEIHKYIEEANKKDFDYLIEISNQMLDKCNERRVEPEWQRIGY